MNEATTVHARDYISLSILLPHCSYVHVIAFVPLSLTTSCELPHADRVSQSHHNSSPIWDTYRLLVAPIIE